MMEHVLMDERGNTTKPSYVYEKRRSPLAFGLFASMILLTIGGGAFYFLYAKTGPSPAATFTPFLSSPQAGFGGHCTITPDAEDFAPCSSEWELVTDSQVLRCPSGYGNIEVLKVKDGETGKKNYRDMALLRNFCKGMDNCKLTLGELRANDDGMPLENEPLIEEADIIEIEPEAIIEDVAGVDSNGQVLMKHHAHHHHHHSSHPGRVKIHYECEKLHSSPFEALEMIFSDLMSGAGPAEVTVQEGGEEDIASEFNPYEEQIANEETPVVFLSKGHGGKCNKGLKNLAQDWDAGTVCGTIAEPITLSCDSNREGARIFVMAVKPKTKHVHNQPDAGANDPVIEDNTNSVENEPFLARRGGGHGHHKHGGKHKQGSKKEMGWQLTDVCSNQGGECTTTLNVDLQAALAENPLVDETTPIHVKYMCSYDHQANN